MKGVAISQVGSPAVVVDDLEIPEPDENQVLVKSIYTAINPVDSYMAMSGILVVDWPFILGCDAAGIVVKAGSAASTPLGPLKPGDEVCGCTRLGTKGHSTCQEFFLMDAALTIPKPKNISLPQAATIGVGAYTACLGVFNGLRLPLPSPSDLPTPRDEWALVIGGASSVGKYAVQLLVALGFKVITTCSARSNEVVRAIGASANIDYKKSQEDQISEILSVTGGRLGRIFDSTAANHDFAKAVFKQTPGSSKLFATTCDWIPMPETDFEGGIPYQIKLGSIGQPDAAELNQNINSFISLIVGLVEAGKIVPSDYDIVGSGGFQGVAEAWKYQQEGKGGSKKVLVKLQDV
ncbi:GroES-like protein [Lepidopterella palustris CBS 459.81]|uniref:GroES-like protein n=1 Tax=Lepidopterella palustris CBS 459.81 TaxID=1314670 RepID=A0A8E2JHW5_9PEZI|nr:GroES-like protein [Lepidopterella palustris CBS 459.81]